MGIPATLSSVPAQTPYIQYVATSGQTVFPYPFVITQDSDLVVVDNGTTLQTDQGYTLSGVGNSTGGNVTFTSGATSGDIITLYRDIQIERITQIGQNSGFSSTAFNAEFNNLYLIAQQLAEAIGLCLQVPNTNIGSPVTTLTPGAYANKYLSFDSNGNPTPGLLTSSGSITQSIIGGLLYTNQTPAEAAVNVTPVNAFYPEGTSRRYGVTGNGVSDDTNAINNWIKVVVQGELEGKLYPGTFLISSPIVINTLGRGFKLEGPSSSSCLFVISNSFSGGTKAIQLKGNGSACQWTIGGFAIEPNASGCGSATTLFQVGDPATAAINIFGFNFSKINDVFVNSNGVAGLTLIGDTNARMIHWVDCAAWGQTSGTCTTLKFTEGDGTNPCFTGDQIFDKCQFVAQPNQAGNYCVSIQATVGPYSNTTGFGSIAGIKFRACDLYGGIQAVNGLASNSAWITDIWFIDGTQLDQNTTNGYLFTSLNTGANIQDIHILDGFVNKASSGSIVFTSTGTGGDIQDIWVLDNWIDNAQLNAISFFGANCFDLHVNGNVAVDCNNTAGAAIEFNGSTGVQAIGNRAEVSLLGQKPQYLLAFDSGTTAIVCIGNDSTGAIGTSCINDLSGATQKVIQGNLDSVENAGPTVITVGGSPFTWTNNIGCSAIVSVSGGTVSSVTNGGVSIASATGLSTVVGMSQSLVVTYSGLPTMKYQATA